MNNRMLASSVLFSLALDLTISAQAQIGDGTTTPPGDTPGVTQPPLPTLNPPLTPPAPVANPRMSTQQGTNATGQWQEVPGGVSSQGRVGVAPGSCPCSITTPNTRPPVGGCNC